MGIVNDITYALKPLPGIAECGCVRGHEVGGDRVEVKQPIASYFENHHQGEIFQITGGKVVEPETGDPDSCQSLQEKMVSLRLWSWVPGAHGLSSSLNLTLCSLSFNFFSLPFPLTPPFPKALTEVTTIPFEHP